MELSLVIAQLAEDLHGLRAQRESTYETTFLGENCYVEVSDVIINMEPITRVAVHWRWRPSDKYHRFKFERRDPMDSVKLVARALGPFDDFVRSVSAAIESLTAAITDVYVDPAYTRVKFYDTEVKVVISPWEMEAWPSVVAPETPPIVARFLDVVVAAETPPIVGRFLDVVSRKDEGPR